MEQIELIEKRKPREKYFLQKDGTIRAEIYDTDVHYLKNGRYEEIDNTLVKENDSLVNKSNDFKVEFKENFEESLMKIVKNNNFIDFKIRDIKDTELKSARRKISKQVKNAIYNNITDDIAIEYQTLSNKVKETIVLQNANHSELSFELNTNLNLKEELGEIIASDENGKFIFKIEKPFMIDSNGARNDNIYYVIKKYYDAYILNLVLDDEWLSDIERKFPVYVDPTINSSQSNINIYDTFIYPGDTNISRGNLGYLVAGVEKINNQDRVNRTLIKFDLPSIGTGYEIISATLDLISCLGGHESDFYDHRIEVHRITEDWNENDANWNNMNDKYDSRTECITPTFRRSIENNVITSYPISIDITGLVKKWYEDTPNYGIMIKSCNETYINDEYPMFYSKNNAVTGNPKPVFVLIYRNQNGYEEYLDYKEQLFTDGKALINTHTGNLLTVFDIGNTVGGTMPASISLIYNTNDVVLENETFFGKGYRLNLEQIVEKVDDALQYLDEDGTIHFFYKKESDREESNVYYDEEGLNLKIVDLDTNLKMIDVNNTEMIFSQNGTKYYLTEIIDVDQNTIRILYNSNNSINKVVDKYGSEINIQYNTNEITITSPNNKIVNLEYTNSKLTNIESINGTTQIAYNSNNIISEINDISGLKITYEYYSYMPFRVKRTREVGTNNALGRSFLFKYSIYETSITNEKGIIELISYNEIGNVVSRSILKEENKIIDAYSIEKTYDLRNKLTSETIPNKYIKNYLTNTSFENNSILFSGDQDTTISFDTNNFNSGLRSLKVITTDNNKYIEQNVVVNKGHYYTFSGYIKSNTPGEIILSYNNSNNEEIYSTEKFEISDDFERQDVTIFYPEDAGNLLIKIKLNSAGVLYLDDIQLEQNEVVNYYNIIENSDFSNGLTGWDYEATKNSLSVNPNDYIRVVNIDNDAKALEITMDYDLSTSVSKTFNIKGKLGDTYTISFWYKNEATLPYAPYVGTNLSVFYEPYNDENGHCILSQILPITNGDEWQHFVYTAKSIEDFKSIKIILFNFGSANKFKITNISLYKDIARDKFNYDQNDNLISIVDQEENENIIKYDASNQLISITNTQGENLKYEYDINRKNRILNTISPSGIVTSNTYKNGNLIKAKTSKKQINSIVNGIYKIREKGTTKYIKAELNMLLLEENDCSNTTWFFEKVGEKYKIKYNLNRNFSISYRNEHLILDDIDDNNLFYFEKNDDNSYNIKYDEITDSGTAVKYLNANDDNTLGIKTYDSSKNIDFYIELSDILFIENDTNYTANDRFKDSEIDTLFRKTLYETNNSTGAITKITDSRGIDTEYTYNNKDQCTKITCGSIEINYTYGNNNLLTNILQGNKNYKFTYNEFMKIISTSLNNNTLSSFEYESNNGQIKKVTYGNNQEVEMNYDEFNRTSEIIKADDTYKLYYDTNGNIAKIISDNNETKIIYDKNNRVNLYSNNGFKVKYSYDSENLITNKTYKYNQISHTQTNLFDGEKLKSTLLDNIPITYNYDNLNRSIGKNINNIINTSTSFISNGKRTSNVINAFSLNNDTYNYEYDELLNVKKIYLNNNLIKEYEYDNYNELIKEKNYDLNTEINYTYDNSGNVLLKETKNLSTAIITDTKSFTYSNSDWEDQLTSYNNESIAYDSLGNMTSYKENSYTWKNGIELSKVTNTTNNKEFIYKYDVNGKRISKICDGTETKYYMLNNDLLYEDRNGIVIYYLYDSEGIVGFKYNENVYYYLKNLQDDIIGIMDENGTQLVKYEYDSWGKLLSIRDENNNELSYVQNHIANINPFRYRSYYYDIETGLYYLNNRYYNPELMRFISPDLVLGANGDILSYNLYSYVSNNPISNYDITGNSKLLNKIIAAVVNFVFNKKSKKSNKSKKTKKSSSVAGLCKEKKPKGFIDTSYGGGTNIKMGTTKKIISSTTTYYNTCGAYSDTNFGSYGLDVGPTSFDFYSAAVSGDTTFKNTYGVDGDYVYFGYDLEINTGKNESMSTYGRINVRKEVAEKFAVVAIVAVVVFVPESSPAAAGALATVSEKAATIYGVLKGFSHALGF